MRFTLFFRSQIFPRNSTDVIPREGVVKSLTFCYNLHLKVRKNLTVMSNGSVIPF